MGIRPANGFAASCAFYSVAAAASGGEPSCLNWDCGMDAETRTIHRIIAEGDKKKLSQMRLFEQKSWCLVGEHDGNDMADDVTEENDAYEKCAVCGRQTDVLKTTNIAQRKTFYPGVGQLCETCCFDLYHTCDLRTLPTF